MKENIDSPPLSVFPTNLILTMIIYYARKLLLCLTHLKNKLKEKEEICEEREAEIVSLRKELEQVKKGSLYH